MKYSTFYSNSKAETIPYYSDIDNALEWIYSTIMTKYKDFILRLDYWLSDKTKH